MRIGLRSDCFSYVSRGHYATIIFLLRRGRMRTRHPPG
jgi:hypothetical protein